MEGGALTETHDSNSVYTAPVSDNILNENKWSCSLKTSPTAGLHLRLFLSCSWAVWEAV